MSSVIPFMAHGQANAFPPFQETKVGLTVGRLRTHEATEVSDLAKEIVKKWKGDVDEEKKRKCEHALLIR